jgi:hypothetical protein
MADPPPRPVIVNDFDIKKFKALQELLASITTHENNLLIKFPTEYGYVELKISLNTDIRLQQAVAAVFSHGSFEYFGLRTPDTVQVPIFTKRSPQ